MHHVRDINLVDFFFDADDNGKKIPVYKYSSKNSVIKEIEENNQIKGTRVTLKLPIQYIQ